MALTFLTKSEALAEAIRRKSTFRRLIKKEVSLKRKIILRRKLKRVKIRRALTKARQVKFVVVF